MYTLINQVYTTCIQDFYEIFFVYKIKKEKRIIFSLFSQKIGQSLPISIYLCTSAHKEKTP